MKAASSTGYIALLRGINVGGNRLVPMADLRELLTRLGFDEVRSLLQSGNVVFRSPIANSEDLERRLEQATGNRFGFPIDFFVRTGDECRAMIADNPFQEAAQRDPGHLLAMFLKPAPAAEQVAALRAAIVGSELVEARGRHAYIVYPDGIGRSKLTINLIEKKLGARCTGRNWNTVLKLAALATA